jgi:hypothetical protein
MAFVTAPSDAALIEGVPGGVLWLKADSLSASHTNGQTVNTWNNSVSGAGTAGNAVRDSSDPAFVTNAIGGMPAVEFDDGDGTEENPDGDSMKVNSFQSTFVDNKKFTVFMVTDAENTVFGPTPTSRRGSINRFYPRRGALTYQTSGSVREDLSIASQAGAAEITVFQHTGSQIGAWLNGVSQGTAAIGPGNIGGDRQQQGDEDTDDGDHHQQLDQGKAAPAASTGRHDSAPGACGARCLDSTRGLVWRRHL